MNRWLSERLFWPLTEGLMGRNTMRRVRELTASQRWPAEKLSALQTRKLRRLLQSAHRHCPFYARRFREAGMNPDDPGLSTQDLQKLPILTREEVREHLHEMTWLHCPGGAHPYSTGGSSGEPLKFYFDRSRQAADWAARWRARGWWQIRPGDREILLWGAPVELKTQDRLKTWRDRLLNQILLSAFDMTAGRMDAYIAAFQRFRPACVYGYPSSLALLARHALEKGSGSICPLRSSRLRAVFVTGEVLDPRDREAIEDAFGAPVVIEYGCRDGGLLACGCREGRLHVPEENVVLEVLDPSGRPVSRGETGEVVVTNLDCYATPMIRYRTGDLAVLGGRGCACGVNSTTLLEVAGRKTDQIVCRTAEGLKRMHALSLIYVLREIDGLRQFRITQRSLDALDVELVPGAPFTDVLEQNIVRGLRERVGHAMNIRILRRERILPTASGKHACVISECNL